MRPWFSSFASNSLESPLTTFSGIYYANGHFLITMIWVAPHFSKMLAGMEKVGLTSKDTQIYFTAHKTIYPFHTAEMLSGIRNMKPQLEKKELKEIVSGACQAVATGSAMYDKFSQYFNTGNL